MLGERLLLLERILGRQKHFSQAQIPTVDPSLPRSLS
jgi:hypothetical protein